MRTKVTLGGGVSVRVDIEGVVGARLQTGLAADAPVRVKVHYAVVARVERRDRANRDARGPFTVIAAHHREQPAIVGKGSLLDVLDPGAVDANGDLMFALARYRAGVATDTFAVVDYEAKLRHAGPFLFLA